jgi:APA family basic amino acid/polyamine antiporter
VDAHNWTPFIPANTGEREHFGFTGVMTGAGIVFFAYIGFDAVSTAAQEAKNPARDMPIGIIGSLLICTLLYILVAGIATGAMSYKLLDVPDPIAVVADYVGLGWMSQLIKLGAIAGLSSVILVMLLGQSRVFYSMARDGFLPPTFSAVHKRFHTPHRGTIITGLFATLLAALFPLDILADLVSIGTLLAFVAVCAGIMILRVQAPKASRQFKTPWVWLVAPAGIATCGLMMFSLSEGTWIRLVLWTAIGIVIYFVYGYWHAAPSKWKVSNES